MQFICIPIVPFVLHLIMSLCKLDEPPFVSLQARWDCIRVPENCVRICEVLACPQLGAAQERAPVLCSGNGVGLLPPALLQFTQH